MLGVVTVWAPALLRYDPMEIHSHDQFLAPGYRYTLGTDFLGRDVLSRTVKGFRSSIPRVLFLTVLIGGVSWLASAVPVDCEDSSACCGVVRWLSCTPFPLLSSPLWCSSCVNTDRGRSILP